MVKQEAMECLQSLPDTAEWEDIQYALYVIQKVEKGRKEARQGKDQIIKSKRMDMIK
jgi:hypothetical protein